MFVSTIPIIVLHLTPSIASKLICHFSHLDSRVVHWIDSLVTYRVHHTKTGHDSISYKIITNTGTLLQGTELLPVLFTINSNVLRVGSILTSVLKFANHPVLLSYITDFVTEFQTYFDDVARVTSMRSKNDLTLNTTKTH